MLVLLSVVGVKMSPVVGVSAVDWDIAVLDGYEGVEEDDTEV